MADIDYIVDRLNKAGDKIDVVHSIVVELKANMDNTVRRIDKQEEKIESHGKVIQRATGVIAGIGLVAGGLGASIAKLFNGG